MFDTDTFLAQCVDAVGKTQPRLAIKELLEEAVAKRSNCLVFLRNDPRLQPLRADARFDALLTRVGLDDTAVAAYRR